MAQMMENTYEELDTSVVHCEYDEEMKAKVWWKYHVVHDYGETNLMKVFHRDNDLPAIVYDNGSLKWYWNGDLHRPKGPKGEGDNPSVAHPDGTNHWFKNGKRHRDNDLPAVVSAGIREWWIDGTLQKTGVARYSEDDTSVVIYDILNCI